MVNEELGGHPEYDTPPIPTYDEAVSRPSSSQSIVWPSPNQDAEREGLLARRDGSTAYRQPTVESARSSLDLDGLSDSNSSTASTEHSRREVDQMDIVEPTEGSRRLAGGRLSKHISTLTHTLSTLQLPQLPGWVPSLGSLREHTPIVKLNWILLGRLFALLLVLTLAYLLFLSNLFRVNRSGGPGRNWIEPEALRNYFLEHVDGENIREHLRYLTSFGHMAGTEGGHTQARYIEAMFSKTLEGVGLERFDVYLNYPKEDQGSRRVAIVEPDDLKFEAVVEENSVYPDDPFKKNTPVFHGHSKSGTAQGPLVYANYGTRRDFQFLEDKGINLNGSIALVRYSQQDRALKVKAAEYAGAIGCIIYSDPAEDGFTQGDVYPKGRYMPEDAVQRGSVALTAFVVGDPLSPGFASMPDEPRRDGLDGNPGLNGIPSIPLAWRDAQKLLQALKGHGFRLKDDWGIGAVPDVEWWSGDNSSPIVLLNNDLNTVERSPIFNVLGRINGVEQREKSIIVGNHRDAWCFGAADPNGATATMLEVIRLFGDLRGIGWRPLRTIEFASWDGEEYNLIGSTEHVEGQIENIRRNAFAYLNVDVAVVGQDFRASASPVLEPALLHVLERIVDPHSNKTIRALFNEKGSKIEGLNAGSDHAAFQMLGGCSSLDFGFSGPPYPYHSCYDNQEWMENFGDPGGLPYHQLTAKILALLILELADREVLPFDFEAYADAIHVEIESLEKFTNPQKYLDYSKLHSAAKELSAIAHEFHQWSQAWSNTVYGSGGGFESAAMAAKRISHNTRMANFETNLLDVEGGLLGREQYKHVLMAPQRWDGYATSYFPSIRDAVEDGDWVLAQLQIEKVAGRLSYASKKLIH